MNKKTFKKIKFSLFTFILCILSLNSFAQSFYSNNVIISQRDQRDSYSQDVFSVKNSVEPAITLADTQDEPRSSLARQTQTQITKDQRDSYTKEVLSVKDIVAHPILDLDSQEVARTSLARQSQTQITKEKIDDRYGDLEMTVTFVFHSVSSILASVDNPLAVRFLQINDDRSVMELGQTICTAYNHETSSGKSYAICDLTSVVRDQNDIIPENIVASITSVGGAIIQAEKLFLETEDFDIEFNTTSKDCIISSKRRSPFENKNLPEQCARYVETVVIGS